MKSAVGSETEFTVGSEIGPFVEYSDQSHQFHYSISKDHGKCKLALELQNCS